jgi:hypothetical protein
LPADPFPAVPVLAVPVLAGPLLVVPLLAGPVLVDPLSTLPEAVSVGLVLVPPVPDEFDAGGAGVEALLPGADEDPVALGLAAVDGVAVLARQGVAVAFADAVPSFALILAFAEAVEVPVAVAVALADPVPVAVSVDVAVVVSPGPVLPPTVPPLDTLSVALLGGGLAGLPAGATLGAADLPGLAGLAAEDDGEPDPQAVGWLLPWVAEVPPWPVPPVPELY